VGAGSGSRRTIGRLAALAALALVGSSIALPAPLAAAPPNQPPRLANDADGSGSSTGPIRDLGLQTSGVTRSGGDYVPDVVLVGYRRGASSSDRAAARRAARARSYKRVSRLAPDLERLELEPGTSVPDAVRALKGRQGVRFAEPDYTVTVDHDPQDPIYNADVMWGMYGPSGVHQSAYGVDATAAWAASQVGSHSVFVGVVDTGIDISHRDLAPNIWTNPFETPGNGVDDDGNGYIDDVHGWDFFHDDASVFDSTASDYHGTHVAGTIGAAGANDEGVVGVSWAVTIIPAKFIDGGGSESGAVAALDYLTDLKVNHGLDIVATNNSWGGAEPSIALQDAINRGGDAGILFVAAAGNSQLNLDAAPDYPAAFTCDTRFDTGDPRGYDCLISVAALTQTGALADFSNYGATSVDIGAPGAHIASTYPGNNYAYLDGTSMAAPHVTGALALLASCQASPTAAGLQSSLFDDAVATPSLAGKTATGKRVNVGAMMGDCDSGGPPRAIITTRAGGTDTPADFWIWFSEPVSGLDDQDLSIGGTSTGWSVSMVVAGAGAGPDRVVVDAADPPPGTVSITLAAGAVTGVSQAGPAAPVSTTTTLDTTPPTVTAPTASFRTGVSLSGSELPMQLTWSAGDAETGARYFDINYSTNGGASWNNLTTFFRGTTAFLHVSPSGSLRFQVRATDWAGHESDWSTGATFSPRLVQQTASSVTYAGTWSKGSRSSYSGGSVRYTIVGKRSATYSFTGRAVAFVTTLSGSRGVVRIKVDGVQVARVDLGKTPTAYRRLAWSKAFSSVHGHKVQVVVVGGYGRVDVDAFAVLK